MSKPTMRPDEVSDVLNRPLSRELLARDATRLAYVAPDGTPRSIPRGSPCHRAAVVMWLVKAPAGRGTRRLVPEQAACGQPGMPAGRSGGCGNRCHSCRSSGPTGSRAARAPGIRASSKAQASTAGPVRRSAQRAVGGW